MYYDKMSSDADQQALCGTPAEPEPIVISTADRHTAKRWQRETLSPAEFIKRMTTHVRGEKEGSCWCPAVFEGGKRSNDTARECWVVAFDHDSGEPIEMIAEKFRACGYGVAFSSSHSHMTSETKVRSTVWHNWQAKNPGKGAAAFLQGEKRMMPTIVSEAQVIREDGVHVYFRHQPCPKFRSVSLVKNPWRAANYPDQATAKQAFTDGLKRLADELDIRVDPNALDVARLFYDPRYAGDSKPKTLVIEGRPVDPWGSPAELVKAVTPDETDCDEFTFADMRAERGTDLSQAEFTSAVMGIRNDGRFGRNEWVKVLAAIRHEFTTRGWNLDEGLVLAECWSETWEGGSDPDETERVWRSLHGGQQATGATIIAYAKRDGWKGAAGGFDAGPAHGDAWNGVMFAHDVWGRMLYVAATKEWLKFDGFRWTAMPETEVGGEVLRFARQWFRKRADEHATQNNTDTERLMKAAGAALSRIQRLNSVAPIACRMWGMSVGSPTDFDQDPMLLGVANGVLDLKTGTLLPGHPVQRISKAAGTSFDPTAKAPTFDQFLETVIPDPEVRAFLQGGVGLSLTGDVAEEAWFFLHGSGANGKSVFSSVLNALMGDYAIELSSVVLAKDKHENEAHRQMARLPGIRVAFVNETGQGDIFDDQRMKVLASKDRISARLLHKEAFDFHPTHKLWVRGNHQPGVHDASDAFWRRMKLINFEVTIPEAERIPDLDRRIIREELPGVLNWALDGCRAWQTAGQLETPASVAGAVNEYRNETDVLGQWIAERCEIRPDAQTSTATIFESYADFCHAGGTRHMSKQMFGRLLAKRGIKKTPSPRKQRYIGLALWDARDEHFEDPDTIFFDEDIEALL